jgi:hypothetical protein
MGVAIGGAGENRKLGAGGFIFHVIGHCCMVVQIEEGAAFSRAHWLFARAHGRPNGVPGQLPVRAGKGCGWDGNGAQDGRWDGVCPGGVVHSFRAKRGFSGFGADMRRGRRFASGLVWETGPGKRESM